MLPMPNGTSLIEEMRKVMPIYCHSNKRNTKTLKAQGLSLSERVRLKVIEVHDMFDAGGVMCVVEYGDQPLIMSITGLDFNGNGVIEEKIAKYKKERIEWLKQEELLDIQRGTQERIRTFGEREYKPSRNAPCPCGSGKKYKRCCGKGN